MRSLLVMAMFAVSLSDAAWNGYTEDRELELDSKGITAFDVDAGAGSLVITGDSNARKIRVQAAINVPDQDADEARQFIESELTLALQKDGDRAKLEAFFEDSSWSWGDSPTVDLEIFVPPSLALEIDDSSGSLRLTDISARVLIDDSSGSIEIERVGDVVIDDGSGSILIDTAAGDVAIEDGSGSIKIRHVGGSVTIDDGSGSISVDDVEHDLTIVDDGSGSMNATNVRGTVTEDT